VPGIIPCMAEGATVAPGTTHGAIVVSPAGGAVVAAQDTPVDWLRIREDVTENVDGIPLPPAQGARVLCDTVSDNESRRGP